MSSIGALVQCFKTCFANVFVKHKPLLNILKVFLLCNELLS